MNLTLVYALMAYSGIKKKTFSNVLQVYIHTSIILLAIRHYASRQRVSIQYGASGPPLLATSQLGEYSTVYYNYSLVIVFSASAK